MFLLLSGDVALFDLPVSEEVPEVAKDGEDAVTHVGEDGHQHGRLFKRFNERPVIKAAMMRYCMDLHKNKNKNKAL